MSRNWTIISLVFFTLCGPAFGGKFSERLGNAALNACVAFFKIISVEEPNTGIEYPDFAKLERKRRSLEFVDGLQGIRATVRLDAEGEPVYVSGDGEWRIPIFEEAANIALGFANVPGGANPEYGRDLHGFAIARNALMHKNWSVMAISEKVQLFEYPGHLVAQAWKIADHMDFAISKGKSIHVNLTGVVLERAAKEHHDAMEKGTHVGGSTNWELGRVAFGLLNQHYARGRIRFWRNGKEIASSEVDSILELFKAPKP